MTTHLFKNPPWIWLWFSILFISLLTTLPAQAVTKVNTIEASGNGIIYDLKATSAGTLKVCTKPNNDNDRWRTTIGQVYGGVTSTVGTGSTTTSSGCVSIKVKNSNNYIVWVTWERPMPDAGHFPATVTIDITGPVSGLNESLETINPRPYIYTEAVQGCPFQEGQPEGAQINCGALVQCTFASNADTDTFKFNGKANGKAIVSICGTFGSAWRLYDPNGQFVQLYDVAGHPIGAPGSFTLDPGLANLTTGTYTIETQDWVAEGTGPKPPDGYPYSLALEGISQAFQCGIPMTANGDTKEGSIETCGDIDSYQFNCTAGQVVSISISGAFGSAWSLYDPIGNAIVVTSLNTGTGTCTTDGTYTILVGNSAAGQTGGYKLSLQTVSNP